MYIVSRTWKPLSPHMMKFRDLWIFDLRPFHDFWKKTVLENQISPNSSDSSSAIVWSDSAWGALLKIYNIHTFAPLESLQPFAEDYHAHFDTKVTHSSHKMFFSSMKRLGLDRIGHLKRLSPIEIGKRFGKGWADFMRGIMNPQITPWPWHPFRPNEPLLWKEDLEDPTVDAALIVEKLMNGIRVLSTQTQSKIKTIEISLVYGETETLALQFVHPILISTNHSWVQNLIEQRLFSLQIEAAINRLGLSITPIESENQVQLSLFNSQAPQLALDSLCRKLENQGVQIFKPSSTPSYIPEDSWFRASPLLKTISLSSHRAHLRPLIQFPPRAISAPAGILKKTEQLEWCDPQGCLRSRTYYLTRRNRHWAWVFQTETGRWFEQGVLE